MDVWQKRTLQSFFVPGSLLLLASVVLLQGGFFAISAPAISFYYYAVLVAGILLALRFHSGRILFALISIFLANRAVEFFSAGRTLPRGPGHIALEAVALLLPVNFILITFSQERGLTMPTLGPRAALLFFESVYVAIICRAGESAGPAFLHWQIFGKILFLWTKLPQFAVLAFADAFTILLLQFMWYRQPLGSGLFWSLGSAFLGLQTGGVGKVASAYAATAGLILITSIIENSYALAYQDELTQLPSRRAYNEALLRLDEPYAIAVVDIDHFKNFNDTYGHETGDQVLRLVATKLGQVTGGGQAFRVGGEEFSILFPGKHMKDVVEHLEMLRSIIEITAFRVRGGLERRQSPPRAPDRRTLARKSSSNKKLSANPPSGNLFVTVSIGIAEPTAKLREIKEVIEAADKALYRAKKSGRNRVETATATRVRSSSAGRITA
ncbi:MAG TPA: GGDEF domain-containing protein [Terriglobales bacterium]|nr:GGDEF domain-containing protein [Terriglobales bacterium]